MSQKKQEDDSRSSKKGGKKKVEAEARAQALTPKNHVSMKKKKTRAFLSSQNGEAEGVGTKGSGWC